VTDWSFWLLWHAFGVAAVIVAPAAWRWGVPIWAVRPDWITQVVVMGAAYLGLALLLTAIPVRQSAAGLLAVLGAALGVYGAAYLLVSLRADVPLSRGLVAMSAALASALTAAPILLGGRRRWGFAAHVAILATLAPAGWSIGDREPLQVVLGTRSLSKVPFLIALDQGLYEKYGLHVKVWMPPPEFPGGRSMPEEALGTDRPENPAILVDGQTPIMYRMLTQARFPPRIALAGGDCAVRTHVVGRRGLERLEDLKGKRIGVNYHSATTGFVAHLVAQRMGWDPFQDLSIVERAHDGDALREGLVDAVIANERTYAQLVAEGYPVLANTLEWNEPIAGNSVLVEPAWLAQPGHRDLARRFLQASAEGMALFHRQPDLVLDVLARWNGITDRALAKTVYGRGESIAKKPYPCYDGIRKTMELYDSHEVRRHAPTEFYDDSLIRELDESGFLDALYEKGGG
jgi:ABC-type nitrate/sulfonate/bicarbonate transport system substrate-binding protein